jgi:serine phosphatase RsbU (regulator of sigma subunit)
MLGGDTMSVRLLKNLSKALWATSVRLASQQKITSTDNDTGHETLSEFNRLLRARLLPRVTPKVSGYDIAASTLAPKHGTGCTAWDWFVLTDGRPAFVVTRAERADVFAAQRLASVRMLLRSAASEPQDDLGAMLTRVNRGLRAGWIEGLSGPVLLGLVALADGAAEWVEAGAITGVVVRGRGTVEDLSLRQPSLGEEIDTQYESITIVLGEDDRIVAMTDHYGSATGSIGEALVGAHVPNARGALTRVLAAGDAIRAGTEGADVSAAIVVRTNPGPSGTA